jgi:hypothetical protein
VEPKFIADENVGKLGRYLRRLGFDTALFEGGEDRAMVSRALADSRTILTRDTHIREYGAAVKGRVKVITLTSDDPNEQLRQVLETLGFGGMAVPLSRCLECNCRLETKSQAEVAGRVPSFVLKTQKCFVECPLCRRVYWRGSHWRAMQEHLKGLPVK